MNLSALRAVSRGEDRAPRLRKVTGRDAACDLDRAPLGACLLRRLAEADLQEVRRNRCRAVRRAEPQDNRPEGRGNPAVEFKDPRSLALELGQFHNRAQTVEHLGEGQSSSRHLMRNCKQVSSFGQNCKRACGSGLRLLGLLQKLQAPTPRHFTLGVSNMMPRPAARVRLFATGCSHTPLGRARSDLTPEAFASVERPLRCRAWRWRASALLGSPSRLPSAGPPSRQKRPQDRRQGPKDFTHHRRGGVVRHWQPPRPTPSHSQRGRHRSLRAPPSRDRIGPWRMPSPAAGDGRKLVAKPRPGRQGLRRHLLRDPFRPPGRYRQGSRRSTRLAAGRAPDIHP